MAAQPAAPAADVPPPAASAQDLFDPNRVLKIEIRIDPRDWDTLRNQERDAKAEFGKERLEKPAPEPYTWFPAEVIVDGTSIKKAGVRKRGFFGSADKDRPGLNVDFDRFVPGQQLAGRSGMKLHNNKQDASNLRQALAYRVFAAAGVPAPRCNFAQVTVNGANLGLYSNLEGVDDSFLQRHFGNHRGNLYEAQVSDFRPGWTGAFERKNNKKKPGRAELEAVSQALEADDAQLAERLAGVLDLEAFINFWAVECLINHWDGFTGDLNNTFIYHDPARNKLRFIPWGTDATFGPHHIMVPFDPPASVWAVSHLARRLYNHPVTQERYRARLRELLATVWQEEQLLAEAERMEKLIKGLSTVSPFRIMPETSQLKQFIRQRRGQLEAELNQPAVPWNYPARRELYSITVGEVVVEFSSAWVGGVFTPSPRDAKARVTLDFYGRRYSGEFTDVKAAPDFLNPKNAALLINGNFEGVAVPVSIWFSTGTNQFAAGKTLEVGGPENGVLAVAGTLGKKDWRMLAGGESGSVRLDEAGRTSGAKVRGEIRVKLSTGPWEDFDLAGLKKAP